MPFYNQSIATRLCTGLLMLGLLAGNGAAQAHFMVPDDREQQSAMLTSFYYQASVQAALQGSLGLSTDLMERVYGLNRDKAEFAATYADFIQSQNQHEKVIPVYKDMLTRFHDPLMQSFVHYRLSLSYDGLGQLPQAIDSLEKAIEIHPGVKPAGYYYDLGVFYAKLNRYEQTKLYSQKALEVAPKFAPAWNNFGYSLAKLGEYVEGYSAVKKALELEPDNPNALDSLGFILFKMGRYQESIQEYQKAITLDPRLAESFLYLGHSYEATRNWLKAIDAYETYLKLSTEADEKLDVEKRLLNLRKFQIPIEVSPAPKTPPKQVDTDQSSSSDVPGVVVPSLLN